MSGIVRVRCGHSDRTQSLARSLELVVGRYVEVAEVPGGYLVRVAAAESAAGGGVMAVTGGLRDETRGEVTVELGADEADLIDIARLLGPVLRGRIPVGGLPALVDSYRTLQSVGRELDGGKIRLDAAEAALPELFGSLRSDLARPDILGLWGTSTTVDDGVQQVPAGLIAFLAEQLGTASDPRCCHAGLAHTYGYLLSPSPTEYGRKRHRWSSQEAAHTLGIPGRWPLGAGGVLTNLTEALSQVAPLDGSITRASPPGSLEVLHHLEDNGEWSGLRWRSRVRVIGRPTAVDGGDELLLVYSVAAENEPERYLTAFPVSRSFAARATAQRVGRLRYNAVLDLGAQQTVPPRSGRLAAQVKASTRTRRRHPPP